MPTQRTRPLTRPSGWRPLAAVVALAVAVVGCSSPSAPPAEEPSPTAAPTTPTEASPQPPRPTVTDEPVPGSEPATELEPAPEPPPPVPPDRDELVARITELVAAGQGQLEQATLTVLVTDAYGREIAAAGADEPVIPASTLKIVTAASALLALGPDATLETRVDATAPLTGDGVVDGDLVLVGSGDPALATPEYGRWIYPTRPRTPLEALADDLVGQGLKRVTGGVVGTAPGFAGPTEAQGWLPRYFANFDARYITGLTVDAGLATSIRWPELERERAEAEPVPDPDVEPADDAPAEEPLEPISIPLIGTREEIEGRLAGLAPPLARVEVVADPRTQAARELARLLTERGVEVSGPARAAGRVATVATDLARVESPPLADVLRFAVQRSDNHLTDQLFQVVGHEATGAASWDRAERSVKQLLDEIGVDVSDARFADGSGLSRDDRVTARLLVEVDRAMWNGPHAETWASLQASAGESGTLRSRLRGTPAAGRLLGKTGTLNDVAALTGAVVGDDGGRYHLAVVGNDAEGNERWVVRALMDELAVVLAADLQGCEIAPQPSADPSADETGGDDGADESAEPSPGPLGRPPTVVVC